MKFRKIDSGIQEQEYIYQRIYIKIDRKRLRDFVIAKSRVKQILLIFIGTLIILLSSYSRNL